MLANIIDSIICSTFERQIGRRQSDNEKQYSMDLTFKLSMDINIEEGYRWLDIRVYAPNNYVGVLIRERWHYYKLEDVEFVDEREDITFKEGKGYIEGKENWKRKSYHDSCWRSDGIHATIYEYKDKIISIESLFGWFEKHEMIKKDIEEFNNIILMKE